MSTALSIDRTKLRLFLVATLSSLAALLLVGTDPADAIQQRPGGSLVQLPGTAGCLTIVTRFIPNGGPTVTDTRRLKPS
ncbi:MAG: hypothetical protein ACKOB2_04575 [Solirubrobacterales bacterium]